MNRQARPAASVANDPKQTWRLPTHDEGYSFGLRELSVGSAEIPLDLI
jgi:hypothetical protein